MGFNSGFKGLNIWGEVAVTSYSETFLFIGLYLEKENTL